MPYLPIEDYGVIGNLRTVALIGKTGNIDWLCLPNFDSPSIFAAILDERKGGSFRLYPTTDEVTRKQLYWPDTNVLITRFLSSDGVGEIMDYMPIGARREDYGYHGLVRRLKVVRGTMQFRMECCPAFNYAQDSHTIEIVEGGARLSSPGLRIALASTVPVQCSDSGVVAEFTLQEGQMASFELHSLKHDDGKIGLSEAESTRLFQETVDYWRNWIGKCTYKGRWREMVHRSALVLKLLTFQPTGAIVAAPTCSLPESMGGSRNWDYRYTWIRDAAFTIYAFMRIGFTEEAAAFMQFLDQRCHELEPDGSLQVMYGIDGRHELTESELPHLEGYRGSSPVRVGNAASSQLQLDIYGELMDSVYLFNKHGTPISYELWTYLRRLTNWVCDHWHEKDEAIWEVRGGRRDFVYSKVMCWVAIDRAIRLATKRSFPADWGKWFRARDLIYEDIMTNGWNEERGAFVQYYGSDSLDASTLVMPLVFFVSPTDPRMIRTLEAIDKAPHEGGLVSDGLVFRYDVLKTPDGLKGTEGTFNICSFWLVEALTRAGAGDRDKIYEARLLFEQMLGYANHLGLFAEQIGSRGEALGNFPQAFTHLALISAAVNLDKALSGEVYGRQE
ncbi:MAG: glycoside hydrolase family 15 protein [Bryobacteraceae bacterium]